MGRGPDNLEKEQRMGDGKCRVHPGGKSDVSVVRGKGKRANNIPLVDRNSMTWGVLSQEWIQVQSGRGRGPMNEGPLLEAPWWKMGLIFVFKAVFVGSQVECRPGDSLHICWIASAEDGRGDQPGLCSRVTDPPHTNSHGVLAIAKGAQGSLCRSFGFIQFLKPPDTGH